MLKAIPLIDVFFYFSHLKERKRGASSWPTATPSLAVAVPGTDIKLGQEPGGLACGLYPVLLEEPDVKSWTGSEMQFAVLFVS